MSVLSAIYNLLIGPLALFFEVIFSLANRVVHNPGLAIIFLSLAMNFLVLPLYRRADALQAEERDQSLKMKHWVEHIRKTFKGDERFMILQTYYRQNGYKQTDALKGSISLLLEIPFFIAAYRFLSGLELLHGVPFGPIKDLGNPDALLTIGGFTVNLLPILMTVINCVSAAIYMKGFPLKSKIQMYGMALIFLVFLYTSPAGLVFYWTLNNVFSLFKNVFYKLKNPKLVLSVLSFIVGAAGLVYINIHHLSSNRQQLFVSALFVLMFLPLIAYLAGKKIKLNTDKTVEPDAKVFILGCLFLTLLTGLLIPSAIINASPAEFVDINEYKSPIWYIVSALLLSAGTFTVWFGIFYRLATPFGKRLFGLAVWVASGVAAVNYMFFGRGYGNLSNQLKFDNIPVIAFKDMLINAGVIILLAAVLFIIWKKKIGIVRIAGLTMCIAIVGMSVMNISGISKILKETKVNVAVANEQEPYYTLSKNGKNVIVVMMDRMAAYYLPYLMNEKPELKEKLAGFTFYQNSISYGSATNVGVPAVYGGYEYNPEGMNSRPELSLKDKQNEALKVMPRLFNENGFKVTVFDPTYAGYSWIPDLTIYDEYPEINKFITLGRYKVDGFEFASFNEQMQKILSRNFFCYSLFKISPLAVQPTLYNDGRYNAADTFTAKANSVGTNAVAQTRENESKASGMDERFMNAYAVLENLPKICTVENSSQNTFLMMSNDTTHQPILLKEPEYTPDWVIDNTEFDTDNLIRYAADGTYVELTNEAKMMHYHANMAALFKLGEWFDYMRENGVYDNTRIIIVSDHAWSLWQNSDMMMWIKETPDSEPDIWDLSIFNCMLMVKDFNSKEFTVDRTFMTNADTPSLAMEGLIENPVNPFTGKAINNPEYKEGEQHVVYADNWQITDNNGNTFLPDYWFSVHDDIYKHENWQYLGKY